MKIMLELNEREIGTWNNCKCDVCGKGFHRKPSQIAKSRKHYCSVACHAAAKVLLMRGAGNHQYGLKGSANASWKSDMKETRYGYIAVRCPEHPFRDKSGFVLEHRLVAEEYLLTGGNSVEIDGKKYLKQDYVVHHKNFDRMDNRPENLAVLSHAEHQRLHLSLNMNERNEKGQFEKEAQEIVKVKRVTKTAVVPERKSIGAAGFDLCADITEPVVIRPGETALIYSGIAFAIPKNYFGAIYARSGLATLRGLRPATCVSVIDSDYRGNVGLPIHNDSDKERTIMPHERIAQIVFQKALIPELEVVSSLEETERGENGFGSTGR